MKLFTIGFTKSDARHFFGRIQQAGVKRVVDVRLNNLSQLAGFAKKDDLQFFLQEICHVDYTHELTLAPTQEMLDDIRKHGENWQVYEQRFLALLAERRVAETLKRSDLDGACLLCSEATPHQCHRRLIAEYLQREWGGVEVVHL